MQANPARSRSHVGCIVLIILLLPARVLSADIGSFVNQMALEHQFDREDLSSLLEGAERRQDILDAIAKPAEGLPWWRYRKIFLKPQRIQAGVTYWQDNEAALNRAYARYGVPPEIIVAIIGVETFYGRRTGNYPVLDALYTLGFHYPKRGAFFRKQLREFLLLAREQQLLPTEPQGSYAGAMGRPQFIPSSYRAYAVDFDGDGKTDIWDNDVDVIGSVGNYFAVHHWRKGAPIAAPVTGANAQHKHFVAAGMKPTLRVSQLRDSGLTLSPEIPDTDRCSLVRLEQRGPAEYWAGLHNFYVITRYNHSNLYAMAVYQLSREILDLRQTLEQTAKRDS